MRKYSVCWRNTQVVLGLAELFMRSERLSPRSFVFTGSCRSRRATAGNRTSASRGKHGENYRDLRKIADSTDSGPTARSDECAVCHSGVFECEQDTLSPSGPLTMDLSTRPPLSVVPRGRNSRLTAPPYFASHSLFVSSRQTTYFFPSSPFSATSNDNE